MKRSSYDWSCPDPRIVLDPERAGEETGRRETVLKERAWLGLAADSERHTYPLPAVAKESGMLVKQAC